MSKPSLETAREILSHLESRKGRTAQLGNAVSSMQRRDFDSAVAEIANILDGKPAVEPPAPPAPPAAAAPQNELPKTDKASKETPKAGGKGATA